MIVPYIVGYDDRAQELTQAIGDELELLELPGTMKVVPLTPSVPVVRQPLDVRGNP